MAVNAFVKVCLIVMDLRKQKADNLYDKIEHQYRVSSLLSLQVEYCTLPKAIFHAKFNQLKNLH